VYNRGKGSNPFESHLIVRAKRGERSTKFHIGNYTTLDQAVIARMKFIDSLKY
jgi:hypothetical protein